MTIYIASDHAGFHLKQHIIDFLHESGREVTDLGTKSTESVDYPDYALQLANHMKDDPTARGILICGSGIGISIGANRHPHIRCALCRSGLEATLARQHNDANVVALGERITGVEMARDIVHCFLTTEFEAGRHQRRVDKLSS